MRGLDGFSCSPRYVLNLRRESGEDLDLIGKSWEIWQSRSGRAAFGHSLWMMSPVRVLMDLVVLPGMS